MSDPDGIRRKGMASTDGGRRAMKRMTESDVSSFLSVLTSGLSQLKLCLTERGFRRD